MNIVARIVAFSGICLLLTGCGGGYSTQVDSSELGANTASYYVDMVNVNGKTLTCVYAYYYSYNSGGPSCNWEEYNDQ